MSIIRAPRPESNYYVLSKAISEDGRLSWAARGLLVYLLGKPDNWQVNVESLRKQTDGARIRTGRDGLYALLAELEQAGYMSRQRQRGGGGRLSEVDYTVSEIPVPPRPSNPDVDPPHPAQPDTAQPDTANPTLTSNDLKQELIGTTPQPPEGGDGDQSSPEGGSDLLGGKTAPASKRARGEPEESPAFVRFYTRVYPKREKRAEAARAWRSKGCEAIAEKIIAEVADRAANDPQWRKDGGRYIPHPASYINGRRWEDEWQGRSGSSAADDDVPEWIRGAV
ncbi:MAG: hypothetical protein DI568_17235 [Sphingomonas sp.]|nr:MAG: hypothetical protein DI597_19370 [Pseudoxanthomonas spadix]PZU43469.1 MAG: hypothetical protein DI568_17235 [Sphingomonas sp.]